MTQATGTSQRVEVPTLPMSKRLGDVRVTKKAVVPSNARKGSTKLSWWGGERRCYPELDLQPSGERFQIAIFFFFCRGWVRHAGETRRFNITASGTRKAPRTELVIYSALQTKGK